uniref:Transmembrane protein n=1 Tax=Russula virescens TaxID=71688 RepID=A0A2S0U3Z8_9AGAM|nr:hypothetical protein [Russula virescens]AWB36218.1 hypothetical protein [Russula virescens]
MNNTDLILICTIIGFSGFACLGFVIKCINQSTTLPHNVLRRRIGDIELTDYTPPTQPLEAYFPREVAIQTSNNLEIGIQTSHDLPNEVAIQTSHGLPNEVAIQTSHGFSLDLDTDCYSNISSVNSQPIPPFLNDFIYSPLENENFYSNLINNLLENNLIFYGLGSVSICLITGFCIKSYFFTTPSSPPNSPPTFDLSLDQQKEIEADAEAKVNQSSNLTLEQLSEIINKLNQGEVLDEDIRDKLDQDFKLLINDIQNSSGHHPLIDQPIYINSCLENENMFNLWIILFLLISLFILISLFLIFLNRKANYFDKNY